MDATESPAGDKTPNRRPLHRRVWFKTVMAMCTVTTLLLIGAFAHFLTPFPTDQDRWQEVQTDPTVNISDTETAVILRPATIDTRANASVDSLRGHGLVFEPGARVSAQAYAWNLAPLVNQGLTVVIPKPTLGLAIVDFRPLNRFTDLAPEVMQWTVGGHSMGGVKACRWVEQEPQVNGLILAGSYCSNDLSASPVPVISIVGSKDGLTTPEDVQRNAEKLPSTTRFIEIAGLNHAQFGAYGQQRGDGVASISNDVARTFIVQELSHALSSTNKLHQQ